MRLEKVMCRACRYQSLGLEGCLRRPNMNREKGGQKYLRFSERILCARHVSNLFPCINSLDSHNNFRK